MCGLGVAHEILLSAPSPMDLGLGLVLVGPGFISTLDLEILIYIIYRK